MALPARTPRPEPAPLGSRGNPLRMTAEEYLAFDAAAPDGEQYEWREGVVYPRHGWHEGGVEVMAGAQPAHEQVALNISTEVNRAFRNKGCGGAPGNLRVASQRRSHVYPDLVFYCDEPAFTDDNPPVLLNPTFVVEVLSESTGARDRGEKLQDYIAIGSLREVWLVEQERPTVQRFVRRGDGWLMAHADGLDASVRCETAGVDVALADVYALVEFGAPPPAGETAGDEPGAEAAGEPAP